MSFPIFSRILVDNHDLLYPLHSMPPLVGPHQKTAIPFGVDKLEWCGFAMVKKVSGYVLAEYWHVTDRHLATT